MAERWLDEDFSIVAEIAAAVEADGLLSLFALARDADLRPLVHIVLRAVPAALAGQPRYLAAPSRPGDWPDLLAEALDRLVAERNAGMVFGGGGWREGLLALHARLGLVPRQGLGEAALAEAIAAALLPTDADVARVAADPRVAGLGDVAEAVVRVASLRRTLRRRLGIAPAPASALVDTRGDAPLRDAGPLRAGEAQAWMERVAAGAGVAFDEIAAYVPGADFARLPACNIVVAGRSGAGKSTLLNAVFGRDLAATGIGRPVTPAASLYEQPGFALRVLDTRGLERGGFAQAIAELEQALRTARGAGTPEGQLHLMWLCIDGAGSRIEESDRALADLAARLEIPVIAVITKAWFDSQLAERARGLLPDPPVRAVVPVIAAPRLFAGGAQVGPEGLDLLVEHSLRLLPEAERAAMAAVQRVLLEPRRESARAAIASACRAAALVAANPVPFADAALLAPIQVAMIVAIARRMGVELGEDGWKALAAGIAGPLLASLAGRGAATAIGNLLKAAPGVGSLAGGALNVAVAAALTRFLGEGFLAWLSGRLEAGAMPSVEELRAYLGGEWIGRRDPG
jgi:uncharacterized protein (DUF697 family)/GTP-binding protein EngB required for normal cell division